MINEYEIDELLREMAIEGRKHFAPHYICQRLGLINVNEVTNYLLTLVPKVLLAIWEVECPKGHSHYIVSHPSLINSNELKTCDYCGIDYYPDPNQVWLAFNFNPDYIENIKKKQKLKILNNQYNINIGAEQLVLK